MQFDKSKVYSNGHKFIEKAKIYKQKHEQDVLMGIVGNGCQDEIEFEILKKYLAGTEFVGVNSKRTFDGFKASVANAAWAYVGRKSDANEILSIIAISKINGESDNEIYDKVKDMENFVKIYELLGIRSIKQGLEYTDKFIKRIINKYVARLADEYHIPKPALRKRSVT